MVVAGTGREGTHSLGTVNAPHTTLPLKNQSNKGRKQISLVATETKPRLVKKEQHEGLTRTTKDGQSLSSHGQLVAGTG